MKKYFSKVILICILGLLLVGCQHASDEFLKDDLQVLDVEPQSHSSSIKNLGIYLDVTPSMVGFLGMGTDKYKELVAETQYEICLDEINKIVASKYSEAQTKYYRVDTPLWETNENVLKKGRDSKYYVNSKYMEADYEKIDLIPDDGEEYNSLCISNALLNCLNEDFSIFITDFYENTATGAEVIAALKGNMALDKDKRTIGIIGIKSEFAGMVYDLNLDGGRKEYGIVDGDLEEKDICYRQFYVIVIGNVDTVYTFCEDMTENLKLDEENMKCTVFYENEIYGLDFTSFKQCMPQSRDRKWKLWPNGEVLINNKNYLDVYDYRNKSGESKDIIVSYNVKGDTLKKELKKGRSSKVTLSDSLPGMQEMELVEIDCHMEKSMLSQWNNEEQCFKARDDLAEIFSIEKVCYSPDEEVLYVVFRITEKELPEAPMKLSAELYLENREELVWSWVEEWNLAHGDEDLGKTRNLKDYVGAIKEEMPGRSNRLLNFTFYLNGL